MIGSFVSLVRNLFFSLRGIFNGIVKSILGSLDELCEGIFELLDHLIFGRNLFEERLRGSVRLNGYLAHDLLIRNDEGSRESRKRQDLDEFHDCYRIEGILGCSNTMINRYTVMQ